MVKDKSIGGRLSEDEQQKVLDNIRLVYMIYHKKFRKYKDWEDDIIQEGTIGLIKAVQNFDESRGYAFSTYAYRAIYMCMVNYLNRHVSNVISVPAYKQELYSKYMSLTSWGDSDEEACEKLGCNIEDIKKVQVTRSPCSLNTRVGEEKIDELIEMIPDNDRGFEEDLLIEITIQEVKDLFMLIYKDDSKLLNVFELWCTGMIDARIADTLGYSRERVRQYRGRIERGLQRTINLYNSAGYAEVLKQRDKKSCELTKLLARENVDEILEGHNQLVDIAERWLINNKGKRMVTSTLARENNIKFSVHDNTEFKQALFFKLKEKGLNVSFRGLHMALVCR